MNSLNIIEIVLVGAIVIAQLILAIRTYRQIKRLSVLIPTQEFFSIKKYHIPVEDLSTLKPKEILQNLAAYEIQRHARPQPIYSENGIEYLPDESETDEENASAESFTSEISLVNPNEPVNPLFDTILSAMNVYLLRNKGAITDFNLIKDIVERNVDTEEEEISHSVSIPLYLGLMGTMVGIVFGLVSLFLISDSSGSFDIKPFLGGVSIAMFASFWGLFCTVANSSFVLKRGKRKLEKSKNNFYTFIQTELLPLLNQNISSSVYTLHQNLVKFNDNFTNNLSKLSGLLNKNHDALIAQERILQALENIQPKEFAEANIIVLKELKSGTKQLEKFAEYLNSLNFLASKTSRLSTSFDDLLSRVNNFQGLAEKLDTRVEDSNKLVQFLNDHFKQLEDRGELINTSVTKVDDIMAKSLKQLEEHTQAKIEAIKQNTQSIEDVMIKSLSQIEEHTQAKIVAIKEITIKEEALLTETFAENRSHISKLSLLENLNKQITEFKTSSASQNERLKNEIVELKDTLGRSIAVLKEINTNSLLGKTKGIGRSIKRFFSKRNNPE